MLPRKISFYFVLSRLGFILAGVEFEDKRVKFPEWNDLKPQTPNGKLPVMQIDDGPMLTQSMAMLRWVAAKYSDSLYPIKDVDKMFAVDEVLGLLDDFRSVWLPSMYLPRAFEAYGHPENYGSTDECKATVKKLREKWVKEEAPKMASSLEKCLDKNDNNWLASKDAPTIADCVAVPFLRSFTRGHVDHVPTTVWDDHPKIVDYIKRFCALEGVKGRYNDGIH